MKRIMFAGLVACSLLGIAPVSAQDDQSHDNGLGGTGMGGLGAPMAQGSTFSEDPYRTAVRLIHHDKFEAAIPYIDQAVRDRPTNANALAYAGYAHTKVGQFGTAIDDLRSALASDPDHKAAHQYLGELYLAMHNVTAANGELAELTRLCPGGCDEKDALAKTIADHQPVAASTPPAAH